MPIKLLQWSTRSSDAYLHEVVEVSLPRAGALVVMMFSAGRLVFPVALDPNSTETAGPLGLWECPRLSRQCHANTSTLPDIPSRRPLVPVPILVPPLTSPFVNRNRIYRLFAITTQVDPGPLFPSRYASGITVKMYNNREMKGAEKWKGTA